MNDILKKDLARYPGGKMPCFQKLYRKKQSSSGLLRLFYKALYKYCARKSHIEIFSQQIGAGLYIGHPYCITINKDAVIGENCNIHKGVTIGQENRGPRKGAPTIGSRVWIGVNATIVGKITIGDDVLIAPNSYVNCDVPDHSVVLGNPCIIRHRDNATQDYINHTIQ